MVAILYLLGILAALLTASASPVLEKRATRTTPPAGAIVVSKTPTTGQFSTIQAAVNSLPNDSTSRSIFIMPGTYAEQVSITRTGPLILYGYTTNTATYTSNQVTITAGVGASQVGSSDDLSGTLRIHKDNFAMYNINVRNTFGQGSQALALSSYSNQAGFYASAFFGWQDTVLAEQGNQYFGFCYIEGAVDYIFGQHARAFFQKNVIASVGAGTITADGPSSASDTSLFVINESTIQASTSATSSLVGQVFLGRPWTQWARVAFTSCSLSNIINAAGWEIWSTATPNTADVEFVEYESTGAGAAGTRASFSEKVTSNAAFNVGVVLGSTWASWVDQSYV